MVDRDALLAAVDLRSLADELLGPHAGGERTPTWPCPNPGHSQTGRTPPVTVFTSHRGEPRWRCHGCGQGGTAIDLLIACRRTDVADAFRLLAERAGTTTADWPRPAPRPSEPRSPGCSDPAALGRYVEECARQLWLPSGRLTLDWLISTRGLPTDVLRTNRIGLDRGPRDQPRPEGMPRSPGVVLPVIDHGQSVYAQIRVPRPAADRPRYLNPTASLASSPKVARFRPSEVAHPEVLVTEGAIDALSANAAGYRAVALLSAGYPDPHIAEHLARLPHPLVIAFDPDDPGRLGAHRLAHLLADIGRSATVVDLGDSDLNEHLQRSARWPTLLPELVSRAKPGPVLTPDSRHVPERGLTPER